MSISNGSFPNDQPKKMLMDLMVDQCGSWSLGKLPFRLCFFRKKNGNFRKKWKFPKNMEVSHFFPKKMDKNMEVSPMTMIQHGDVIQFVQAAASDLTHDPRPQPNRVPPRPQASPSGQSTDPHGGAAAGFLQDQHLGRSTVIW